MKRQIPEEKVSRNSFQILLDLEGFPPKNLCGVSIFCWKYVGSVVSLPYFTYKYKLGCKMQPH